MEIVIHQNGNTKVAEIKSSEIIVTKVQDALDIMADADYKGARKIILYEKNIHPDFFKLRTGLAGEILQKFVNYKVCLAIIGDFSKYQSKPLKDFIFECNKGNQLFFVADLETAINKLG